MDYLSRDEFLQALTATETDVSIEGMGTVRVRPLSLAERESIRLKHTQNGEINTMAIEIATVLTGLVEPRLSDKDIMALEAGRAGFIDTIAQEIMGMSGMGEDAEKKVGTGS